MPQYCSECGQWPTHKSGCSKDRPVAPCGHAPDGALLMTIGFTPEDTAKIKKLASDRGISVRALLRESVKLYWNMGADNPCQ